MLWERFWTDNKIKVYALVGESGTGKSFRAKLVAQKYRADFIIDDGLLIRNNRIVAGHSAKKEKTFMAAVKVALFDEKSQRDEVARKLQGNKSRKILILGTSEKMVAKIAARLQLPAPVKIIKIEDIASQTDIENAIRTRRIEGKHVIPVPSVEVKRNYPQIFYDAIRILRQNQLPVPITGASSVHEKSVVRPEYSRRTKVHISDSALTHMALYCADEFDPRLRIKHIKVKDADMGYRLIITLDVTDGTRLGENMQEFSQYIIKDIEWYTGILIEEVNIIIDKIIE
ncbi:MAG: ATP-binding protein [Spirochaetaceae bacterium]|nr:ATP-binding protein [Spirochaetaceae bacterium]